MNGLIPFFRYANVFLWHQIFLCLQEDKIILSSQARLDRFRANQAIAHRIDMLS